MVADLHEPLSGHVGHLSLAQQSSLEKFRSILAATDFFPSAQNRLVITSKIGYDRYDDHTLLRFLRARKFDVEKARIMWEANEKWREEWKVDGIAAHGFSFPERGLVQRYYPQYYHHHDRFYRPLYFEHLGNLDVPKLNSLTSTQRQIKYLVSEYEKFLGVRCKACTEEKGEWVETCCTVLDLKGVKISNFYKVKDYIMAASAIGQNHCGFPETMGTFLIINAPSLFSTIWCLIKPWLDPSTLRKIKILGKDYHAELCKWVDFQYIPEELGGQCRCDDESWRGWQGGCRGSDSGLWNKRCRSILGSEVGSSVSSSREIRGLESSKDSMVSLSTIPTSVPSLASSTTSFPALAPALAEPTHKEKPKS
ncbi:hypothetical protein L204_104786 [Cryptococcus depauperatus]